MLVVDQGLLKKNLLLPWNITSRPLRSRFQSTSSDRLVGRAVKASTSRAAGPAFDSRLRRGHFSGLSYTSDLKIETPVVTLPGVWRYRINARSGWPGVSIL